MGVTFLMNSALEAGLINALINASATILVGFGVYYFGAKKLEAIKSELSIESQQRLEMLKRKREIYEDLCKGLQFFITDRVEDADKSKVRALALETYDKLSLWGSDKVCDAADNFFKAVKSPGKDSKEEYKLLLSAMREDLNQNDSTEYKRDYQIVS